MTGRMVLVVDDETEVRDGIKRVLIRAGFTVRTHEDAADALLDLGRIPADLVISDLIMPKVNGVDFIEFVVKEFPETKILAISGGGNFDTRPQSASEMLTTRHMTSATKAGAHGVLLKPFDSAELLQAVEHAMR